MQTKLFNKARWLQLISCIFILLFSLCVDSVDAAENDVAYTLDFTTASASHSSYGDTWTYGDFSLYGGANNNGSWAYVKFGGKGGSNATDVSTINSTIKSTTTIAEDKTIKKVTVEYTSVASDNYTANKCTLEVASNSTFSAIIDTRIIDNPMYSSPATATSFDFTPNTVTVWPANSYYKITIGATITGKSNIGPTVTKVKFIEGAAGSTKTLL